MNNRKGFISMSLVYSFMVVFLAVSVSLLTIYTEDILSIRRINNEIKEDLMLRGNNEVISYENLIVDGSFESSTKTGDTRQLTHWVIDNGDNGPEYFENDTDHSNPIYPCVLSESIPFDETTGQSVNYGQQTGQAYYGNFSIISSARECTVTNTNPINLKKGHLYYIERIYNAGGGFVANGAIVKFVDKDGKVVYAPTLNNFQRAKHGYGTGYGLGWTMPTKSPGDAGASMGTVEADTFIPENNYENVFIQLVFNGNADANTQINANYNPIYTDGYMLFDLYDSVSEEVHEELKTKNGKDSSFITERIYRQKAHKGELANGDPKFTKEGYFEGRRGFSVYDKFSIVSPDTATNASIAAEGTSNPDVAS